MVVSNNPINEVADDSYMRGHGEIDLFDLIESIWKQKLLVVLISVCSIFLGYCYIAISPEKWTAVMVISGANPSQVDALNPPELVLIAPLHSEDRDVYEDTNATDLMNLVSTELKSVQTLLEFNAQYPGGIFKAVKPLTEEALVDAGDDFINNRFKLSHPNDNPNQISIELTLESPQDASQILKDFADFVDKKIVNSRESELKLIVKRALERNAKKIELAKAVYAGQIEIRLNALEGALRVAELAGIKTRQVELILTRGRYDYLHNSHSLAFLGEAYLKAEIKVVKERSENFLMDPVVGDLIALNENISRVVIDTSEANSFYVQKPATSPTNRDYPKTNFVLSLSALIGGMLGVLIALIRFSVSKYKKGS